MTTITLDTVLEQARQLTPDDQARLTAILEHERAEWLVAALDEWMADESGYDETTWPEIATALDCERSRLGMRILFNE
ncbi:MAG: hypothetical protein HYV63_09295 [Candidatus Schekmanbacteria bacterium]|nr:hypothetical protein [Candidatus Schekmanbacteria bacterium]